VAETRNQALDAAERITIDYEPLPAITRAREALEPDAPLLSDAVPDNLCLDWTWGQTAEVADAIKAAPHVVTIALNYHRAVTNPIGVEGCGEAVAIAHFPANADAVGVATLSGPASVSRVWHAVRDRQR
jgi:aerobic carbon-monoxide dehydrogenase large subunit